MHNIDFIWKGVSFLIADDDKYSHLLLDKVLTRAGANVFHAYNGSEAIDFLRLHKSQIDIAIIDIIMPVYNGYEVAEIMSPQCPDTIFVAYSADILRLEDERCRKAGFSKFFPKPMLPFKLLSELDKLLIMK